MLSIDTPQSPPPFRKPSLFRRFTRRERPLEISSPIISEAHEPQSPPSPRSPRKLRRRSTAPHPARVSPSPPTLPPLNTKPTQPPKTFVTHIRVDSAGSFHDLPISQQFSRPPPHPSTPTTHARILLNAHPTSPFPHNTRISAWDLFLPPAHAHALYTGAKPQTTSDQWFVYSEGPDVNGKLKIHFHRAWTGAKVAELFVVVDIKGEGAGKVVGIKWSASEQCMVGEEEARRAVRRGCREALGVELEGGEF